MTSRILPREEWPRLRGTEAETVWPHLGLGSEVLVVEDEGRIVGCWVFMTIAHVECLWKDPHYGSSVSRRLLLGMRDIAADHGTAKVWTAALSDEVKQLLSHVGAEQVPGDHYIMSIGKGA